MASFSLDYSILIPTIDGREQLPACLQGWVNQTFPADRFEIVPVLGEENPSLETEIASYLRPQDHVEGRTQGTETRFWDFGSRRARGRFLFITEAHCIPDPGCLEAIDRALREHPEWIGACCRSVPVHASAMSLMDATSFHEGFDLATLENSWRKLIVHGTAIDRELFLRLGGFPEQYGRFGEWVLQARLHEENLQIGFVPDAIVRHTYRETLQELIPELVSYTEGECIYHRDHPHVRIGDVTCWPPEWTTGHGSNPLLARDLRRATPLQLSRFYTLPLNPHRLQAWKSWMKMKWTQWQTWRHREDAVKVDAPYREFKAAAVHWARHRFLASQSHVVPAFPLSDSFCEIDRLPEESTEGFYCLEKGSSAWFRWSRPSAGIEVNLPANAELQIETGGIRGPAQWYIRSFHVNGHKLSREEWRGDEGRLILTIPSRAWNSSGSQRIVWRTTVEKAKRRESSDRRRLGMPIVGVQAIPIT